MAYGYDPTGQFSDIGVQDYYSGILGTLARAGRMRSRGVPTPAPADIVVPGQTKEDLESARRAADDDDGGGAPSVGVGGGGGAGGGGMGSFTSPVVGPFFDPSGGMGDMGDVEGIPPMLAMEPGMPEPPHIRYGIGGGPLQDYEMGPGARDPGFVGAGFMGTKGTRGGGGFSPSAPWEDVASPESFPSFFEQMQTPLIASAAKAEQERLRRSIEDPMWEERAKAKIWTESQVGVQTGIRDALVQQATQALQQISEEVRREMPGATPEQQAAEIQRRFSDWQFQQGNVRTPSSYTTPGTIFE